MLDVMIFKPKVYVADNICMSFLNNSKVKFQLKMQIEFLNRKKVKERYVQKNYTNL